MAEEPTGWELHRALEAHIRKSGEDYDRVSRRLDEAVTRPEFTGEQRRVNERIHDMQQDLANETAERVRGDANQQTTLDKQTDNMKWLAAAILLPIGLFLASLYITARGGG